MKEKEKGVNLGHRKSSGDGPYSSLVSETEGDVSSGETTARVPVRVRLPPLSLLGNFHRASDHCQLLLFGKVQKVQVRHALLPSQMKNMTQRGNKIWKCQQWLLSLSATPTSSPTTSGKCHPTHHVIRPGMALNQGRNHLSYTSGILNSETDRIWPIWLRNIREHICGM